MNKIIVPSTGMGQSQIATVNAYIKGFRGKNEGFTLEIKPIRDLRSLQQNKLWWLFMEAVGRKIGEHKEWCADLVKKRYMESKDIKEWIETSKMDVAEMNSILEFAFNYLLSDEIDGNLTIEEGNDWLCYQREVQNEKH